MVVRLSARLVRIILLRLQTILSGLLFLIHTICNLVNNVVLQMVQVTLKILSSTGWGRWVHKFYPPLSYSPSLLYSYSHEPFPTTNLGQVLAPATSAADIAAEVALCHVSVANITAKSSPTSPPPPSLLSLCRRHRSRHPFYLILGKKNNIWYYTVNVPLCNVWLMILLINEFLNWNLFVLEWSHDYVILVLNLRFPADSFNNYKKWGKERN